MDIDSLAKRLGKVKASLQDTEVTMKHVSETLKNSDIPENERLVARDEFFSHLKDYEKAYELANEEYQQGIQGLSEAYLSMCPEYQGPCLPKTTFLDSSNDIKDLYGLFLMAGMLSLYGPLQNKSMPPYNGPHGSGGTNTYSASTEDSRETYQD